MFALETRASTLLQSEGREAARARADEDVRRDEGALTTVTAGPCARPGAPLGARRRRRGSAAEIRAYADDSEAEAEADEVPSFERPRTAQPRVLVSTPPRALIQSRSMVEVGSLLKTRPASASGRRG